MGGGAEGDLEQLHGKTAALESPWLSAGEGLRVRMEGRWKWVPCEMKDWRIVGRGGKWKEVREHPREKEGM